MGGIINLAGDLFGSTEQDKGLRRAANEERDFRQRLLDFTERQYAEAQPFRDISRRFAETGAGVLPNLRELATSPELSAGFETAAREGLNEIRQQFASTGSPNSGASQLAAGRFMTGLANAERERQTNNLFRLAGFGPEIASGQSRAALEASLRGFSTGQVNTQGLADIWAARGANQAGMYSQLGQQLGGMLNNGFLGGGFVW